MAVNIYGQISKNVWKSYLIMVLFVVFATTIAYILQQALGYGPGFTILILFFAFLSSIGSYYFSDKIVLGASGAKQIQKKDNPELFRIVENLAIGDGLPMPKLYVINDPSPNAFATGRSPKHAAVAVTSGILERLNKAEMEGVIAHELSHVKNFDTRLLAITAVLVGFITLITEVFFNNLFWGGFRRNNSEEGGQLQIIFLVIGIILAILAPIIASLIQLAVSRKRELLADASGALLTRYPEGLASALEKISSDPRPLATATNATAHLFIVNPFKGGGLHSLVSNLFSTHPPTAERIKILRSM